jgi:hypothetical protein
MTKQLKEIKEQKCFTKNLRKKATENQDYF